MIAVMMIGQKQNGIVEVTLVQQLEQKRAEALQTTELPTGDVDTLQAEYEQIRGSLSQTKTEAKSLELGVKRLESQWKSLSDVLTHYDRQYADLRDKHSIPYDTLDDFKAAHTKAMKKMTTAAAQTATAAETATAAVVAVPTPKVILPNNLQRPEAAEEVEEEEEEPEEEVIAPDPKFLKMDVTSRRKTRTQNRNWDYEKQSISLKVDVTNGNFNDSYDGCVLYVMIIGEHMNQRRVYKVLEKRRMLVDLPSREAITAFEGDVESYFYDHSSFKYGFKYDSYLVVLCDQDGKPVISKSARSTNESKAEKLLAFQTDDLFDADAEPVAKRNIW